MGVLNTESKAKVQFHALLPSHNDQRQVTRIGRPYTRFPSLKMFKYLKKTRTMKKRHQN